jgi:hypothetical protein
MIKILPYLFFLLSLGCTSLRNNNDFEDRMNSYIGRSMKFNKEGAQFGVTERTQLENGGIRLVFEEGKCVYAMFLNDQEVMVGWSYIGRQSDCLPKRHWWHPF